MKSQGGGGCGEGSAISLLPAFSLREPQSCPSCLCCPAGPSHFLLPLLISSGGSQSLCPVGKQNLLFIRGGELG